MSAPLSIVSATPSIPRPVSLCDRVHRLQVEARMLANDHIQELLAALVTAAQISSEVATGGDPYPAGIRDEARRAEIEIAVRAATIEVLSKRMMA